MVAASVVHTTLSYAVDGIDFDFNCGNVPEMLHRLCETYQPHFSTYNATKRGKYRGQTVACPLS